MNAVTIFNGSDAAQTKAYYARLQTIGPLGVVAMNLLRAQKASSRAKVYRGGAPGHGSYSDMAYHKKNWTLQQLCEYLEHHASALAIRYGWKKDPREQFASWVLYVDLPTGQVSFHSPSRHAGPDYSSDWDGLHLSINRIIAFCDMVTGHAPGLNRDIIGRRAELRQPTLFPASEAK